MNITILNNSKYQIISFLILFSVLGSACKTATKSVSLLQNYYDLSQTDKSKNTLVILTSQNDCIQCYSAAETDLSFLTDEKNYPQKNIFYAAPDLRIPERTVFFSNKLGLDINKCSVVFNDSLDNALMKMSNVGQANAVLVFSPQGKFLAATSFHNMGSTQNLVQLINSK